MMTAATAIARSISHTEIVTVPWSAEMEIDLLAACDDSADTTDVQEYWGTDEDGAEWRVHLDTTARMATIERAIRDLATQDEAGDKDDHYARTGSATATIERWRTSAAEAGDHALVAIIDAAGVKTAAKVYRDARS